MTSIDNNLKDNLTKISTELSSYDNLSRSDLFTKCINEKLQATLERYNYMEDYKSEFLANTESDRVFKAILKIERNKNKEAILAAANKEENK